MFKMKSFSCALISSLALVVAANPLPSAVRYTINDRDATVSEQQVSTLEFYAQYAAAGYCNAEAAINSTVTCGADACPDVTAAGAKILATFSGVLTDAQGFVSADDTNQLIVVSFKGSHTVRNWITDFVFLQILCDLTSGCLVHAGFMTAWLEIKDGLLAGLEAATAAYPSYKVVFTGHSLGGAVGTVAAAYAREEGHAVDVVSFGSPRVGNKAFVEHLAAQAGAEWRVTHEDDPVPRLPPVILNYRHTSPEYWLTGGGTNTTEYAADDIEVCDGFANLACNGGTLGLDGDAHGFYFGQITACGSDEFEFRRRDVTRDMATSEPQDVTDDELLTQLNDWVSLDKEFVAGLDE